MFTAVLVIFATQSVAVLFTWLYYSIPKRIPTIDSYCLGRAFEMEEVEFDYYVGTRISVPIMLIIMFGIICVICEIVCYMIIFVSLYNHDQGMRHGIVTVPERNIRRRVRTSAITLLGHFIGFLFDLVFLIIGITASLFKSKGAKFLLPNVSFSSPFGIQSILQVVVSQTLQDELANMLDTIFFVPEITNIFRILNSIGILPSIHARLFSFRMRYL